MPKRLYSPQLSGEVVRALYHEARNRRMPMTRLANTLLQEQLRSTTGWQQSLSARVLETPPARE